MWTQHWSLEDRVRGILDEERLTRTKVSGFVRSAIATFSVVICGLMTMPQLTASQTRDDGVAAAKADASRREPTGPVTNEMTRALHKSFAVSAHKVLRFENLAGRVELVPGDGPMVEVAAIVRVGDLPAGDVERLIGDIQWVEARAVDGSSRWGLAVPDGRYSTVRYPVSGETKTDLTTIHYLDREIRIASRRAEWIPSVEFDLRISLPAEARVAVYNAVGPVEAGHVVSQLDVATHHGLIRLDDVRGPIIATSELGDILISQLSADAIVRTGRGGIELQRVTNGQVSLATRSGDCRILQPPAAPFHLQYRGNRPISINVDDVMRIATKAGDRRTELLSRGTGGPAITVNAGSGETVIEAGP